MKPLRRVLALIAFFSLFEGALSLAVEPADWSAVDAAFGRAGASPAAGVRRYGFPRADLKVQLDGITIAPALALGSWAAFHGSVERASAMGDLVLREAEVTPVIDRLLAGRFEILAIHNHLLGEEPHVLYVHFHGAGEATALAKVLRAALEKTTTPLSAPAPAEPLPGPSERVFEDLQASLGRKGTLAGPVLQVGVPRSSAIREDGMEVPAAMGMATALNFQAVGDRVAATGDFVLTASEVDPVVRVLRERGIAVTALHSHMLREEPRLFFLHFWVVGRPADIGDALRSALARTAVRP